MAPLKINVLLLQRVANVGKEGEIVEATSSYARNFLIPKGLAREVTPAEIAKREADARKKRENANDLIKNKHRIQETLHSRTLEFKLRGQGTKVFGGVSEIDVVEKIAKAYDIHLEKGHVVLPEGKHLKKTGDHAVHIDLGHDVYIRMTVHIDADETR